MKGKDCCSGPWAWVWLIIGIIYLLTDLGIWDWWTLNWWTVVFIIFGLSAFSKK